MAQKLMEKKKRQILTGTFEGVNPRSAAAVRVKKSGPLIRDSFEKHHFLHLNKTRSGQPAEVHAACEARPVEDYSMFTGGLS